MAPTLSQILRIRDRQQGFGPLPVTNTSDSRQTTGFWPPHCHKYFGFATGNRVLAPTLSQILWIRDRQLWFWPPHCHKYSGFVTGNRVLGLNLSQILRIRDRQQGFGPHTVTNTPDSRQVTVFFAPPCHKYSGFVTGNRVLAPTLSQILRIRDRQLCSLPPPCHKYFGFVTGNCGFGYTSFYFLQTATPIKYRVPSLGFSKVTPRW